MIASTYYGTRRWIRPTTHLNVSTSLNRPTMVPATLCVRMFRWQRKVSSTAFRQLRRGRAGAMYALGGWTLVPVNGMSFTGPALMVGPRGAVRREYRAMLQATAT